MKENAKTKVFHAQTVLIQFHAMSNQVKPNQKTDIHRKQQAIIMNVKVEIYATLPTRTILYF